MKIAFNWTETLS